jgi:hypothetical protein
VLAALVALWLQNAVQAFQILLQIGAGTGLIFILRWFWWSINAWGEVAAMVISFSWWPSTSSSSTVALGFTALPSFPSPRWCIGVGDHYRRLAHW